MSRPSPPPDAMSSSSSSTSSRPAPYQQSYSSHNQHRPSQGGMRNYSYGLEVVQQPIRARMCGFGDKDRRPITPPVCIKLRVWDENGQEVHNLSDVDCSFFVLSADLWDVAGTQEQNLVMHPSNTSAAASAGVNGNPNSPTNPGGYQHQSWGASHAPPMDNGHYHHQGEYPPQSGYMYGGNPSYPGYGGYNAGSSSMHHFNQHDDYAGPPPQGGGPHFTRNLIGSLTASAFRLLDDKNQTGIWFILQDLSVRTEGHFRLKLSFLNLGSPLENGNHRGSGITLNTGKSKVLTTIMSDPFQVFSAKRFPGMIESTPLSRRFASQGIRIPVRHNDKSGQEDDYPNDD